MVPEVACLYLFYRLPPHRSMMTPSQKFCTECGAALSPGMKFCGQCGACITGAFAANTAQAAASAPNPGRSATDCTPCITGEQVAGIVPFIEQGLLSVIHYTLVITNRRLIFCTWDPGTDEAMSDADDAVMQESCNISETADEITHFRAKDWAEGPWQKYRSMDPDAIVSGSPGTIVVPLPEIVFVDIVCETRSSTQDSLYVDYGQKPLKFDLMYSQGPFLFRLLVPVLGDRVRIADHLHKRHGIDRLITGQEYK